MSMEICLELGNLNLKITTSASFQIEERVLSFLSCNKRIDSVLEIVETDVFPSLPSQALGEDLFIRYYEDEAFRYAVVKPGAGGLLCMTVYRPDWSEATMFLLKDRLYPAISSIGKVIQLFPIRALLARFNTVLLHASQVVYSGVGILFTAPSGTGKSTQARLWNEATGAFIACNDRTLVFQRNSVYMSSGFPADGSDPVYCAKKQKLGAIVVIRQGPVNSVRRINAFAAAKYLMEQTVADYWDVAQRQALLSFWFDLLAKHPVYELICTPDQRAVHCLQRQLLEDKVIK